MNKGRLFLIPSSLGEKDFDFLFPRYNAEIINDIDVYIVEDLRTGPALHVLLIQAMWWWRKPINWVLKWCL